MNDIRQPSYREFRKGHDDEVLIELLTTDTWPLRLKATFTRAEVEAELSSGEYGDAKDLTFFIEVDGSVVGLVRLEDAYEERMDPQLDIRFRAAWRGKGLGEGAVRFITDEFFTRLPARVRIEGQTRRSNVAMRKVFVKAGWVKEAVYRQAWPPDEAGVVHDGLGYAITRSDWAEGTRTAPDFSDP